MANADSANADGSRPVVIVAGALAPYTHLLYEELALALARDRGRRLHVLTCSGREPSRLWRIPEKHVYELEVLPGLRWHRSTVSNHYLNPRIIARLPALRPAAVILNDFSPTMLLAASAARARGIPYGLRTDGVAETDPGGGPGIRQLIRRALARGASFGLGPSRGSLALLRGAGLSGPATLSPLFPAWSPSGDVSPRERPHDVLFCGTLDEEIKGASFFTDVVLGCAARGRRLSVRITGEGPMRAEMERRLSAAGLDARFDGFLQQDRLAEAFGSARLLHFPSRGDVWGIVVQEALQSGTVVVASPHSGAARELLAATDGGAAGVVLPLDRDAWVSTTLSLLDDEVRCTALREAGHRIARRCGPRRAVEAYLDGLRPFLSSAADIASNSGPDAAVRRATRAGA